jgi:hypothetical protein
VHWLEAFGDDAETVQAAAALVRDYI